MGSTTQSDNTTQRSSEVSDQQASIQTIVQSLRTLLGGDEQEQRQTFEYLKQALDEDRPSNRRLFQ